MSYNNINFYNNVQNPNNDFTFHRIRPRLPPPHFRQQNKTEMFDEEFLQHWTIIANSRPVETSLKKTVSIAKVRQDFRDIVKILKALKDTESHLQENLSTLSETNWKESMEKVRQQRALIDGTMIGFTDTYMELLRNILVKRSTKRLSIKRRKKEWIREKEKIAKEREERSRHIDERLQKIKDDIAKAKQEEEMKAQADVVLREVLHKKSEAKKCVAKLEALIKLRKARQNTAKGRGESVSESEATSFNNSIDKLKSLWMQKLSLYETEEAELRLKVTEDSESKQLRSTNAEQNIVNNIALWRQFLFGENTLPQRDFNGNINNFVVVRSEWDQFLSSDGTSLPIGWVFPEK